MIAKKYLTAVLFTCLFSGYASAQEEAAATEKIEVAAHIPDEDEELVSHTVAMGETIMLIAKKYKVKPTDIYEYNPDATQGVTKNLVLQIPLHRNYKHVKAKLAAAAIADNDSAKKN
jgi:hypothetical protein